MQIKNFYAAADRALRQAAQGQKIYAAQRSKQVVASRAAEEPHVSEKKTSINPKALGTDPNKRLTQEKTGQLIKDRMCSTSFIIRDMRA